MTKCAVFLSLFTACLLCSTASASQPGGLAGKLITDLGDPGSTSPPCEVRSFEWVEAFPLVQQLDPSDTVTLEMAIIPFGSGETYVGLDELGGPTFFSFTFSGGLVNGLPYNRFRWNNVTVQLRPATQDYMMTVNGVRGGPFAYASFCQDQGGCFTVQAMRLHGFSNEVGSFAWIDSISFSRESAAGQEVFHEVSFDTCSPRPDVVGGVILIAAPPQRLLPGRSRHGAP